MNNHSPKPYLYEVDLMRLIFISGVLMNHVTTAYAHSMQHGALSRSLLEMSHLSLHFTRFGFMFITGLVLVHHYQQNPGSPWSFWYRRARRVGIPYLFWNAALFLPKIFYLNHHLNWSQYFSGLRLILIHGNQFYMYFLFVIIQFYLLFPLFIRWWRTINRQWLVLSISFILQLGFLFWIKYWLPGIDRSSWPFFFRSYGMNVFTYQFYFIFGAFTASNYQKLTQIWLQWHRWIYIITIILAVGTLGLFNYNQEILALSLSRSELIHQPYLLIYSIFIISTTWLLGHSYINRASHTIKKYVHLGAQYSFGVYLTQTIPLMMLYGILDLLALPAWLILLLLPIGYLFVWIFTFSLSGFLSKNKFTSYLVGLSVWNRQQTNKAHQ